ncbi:TPA: glycosyltransferase [Salmonella enterica]|nr:glycosyltransferase [Salmonella enterica subsp. salamae]HCL5273005.1 glycosyltransferase [Salmonella enterica]
MQNKTVTILMATYNGGDYIRNQLLSLQQQTFSAWTLFIQDDGSDDETINIINQFKLNDNRIHIIHSTIPHQGAGRNFLSLVKYSKSDYTIFCDQDDIWLENKISDMVSYAEKFRLAELLQPSIVYADGYSFSDDTGEIDFCGISHNHARDLNGFLFFNGGYQGCSIMFNQAMVKFLSDYRGTIHLHDDITSLAAHALGEVHFLSKKLMLYRQHANAVTGFKEFNGKWNRRLKSDVNYLLSKKHFKVKESFFENYSCLLSRERKKTFIYFIKFGYARSRFIQMLYLIRGRFTLNKSFLLLLLKFILRRKFDS